MRIGFSKVSLTPVNKARLGVQVNIAISVYSRNYENSVAMSIKQV